MAKIKSNASGEFTIGAGTNLTVTADSDGWYKVASVNPWPYNSALEFFTVAGGGSPDFYIDDISITESVSRAEIIVNGGFEEATEPTPPPTPSEPEGEDTVGAIISEFGNTSAISGLEYSTVDAYEGERSIHITGNGEMTTPSKLGLISGKTYNFSL